MGLFPPRPGCSIAAGDKAGETAALDQVLALDPNFQAAIGIRFGVDPAKPSAEVEQQIERVCRRAKLRGCPSSSRAAWPGIAAISPGAQRLAERAYALKPDSEEVLLHYSSILGDTKDGGEARRRHRARRAARQILEAPRLELCPGAAPARPLRRSHRAAPRCRHFGRRAAGFQTGRGYRDRLLEWPARRKRRPRSRSIAPAPCAARCC